MCMLTAASKYEQWTKEWLSTQLILNSLVKGNDDGTGIFTGSGDAWKTEIGAKNILNLGEIIDATVRGTTGITMAHVRAASAGIKVTKENAHPFVSTDAGLILAHNGKLIPDKEPAWLNKYLIDNGQLVTDVSDSMIFLNELALTVMSQDVRDVPLAIQETMKKFTGKFALLIQDTITGKSYAVRGTTAPLHIIYYNKDTESQGYLINTGKEELKIGVHILINLLGTRKDEVKFQFEKINEMKTNTMYELTPSAAIEVCEVKQRYVTTISQYNWENYYGYSHGGSSNVPSTTKTTTKEKKLVKRLVDFMVKHSLSPADIDTLVQATVYTPLSEMGMVQLEDFITNVVPKISAPKQLRKEIADIASKMNHHWYKSNWVDSEIYEQPKFQFPWFFNDRETILKSLEAIK